MFDLQNEPTLTLNEARRLPYLKGRRGNNISLVSINRWSRKGIGGVVLETAKIGGTVVTSAEACIRFIEKLSNRESGITSNESRQRRRQIALANATLDANGI